MLKIYTRHDCRREDTPEYIKSEFKNKETLSLCIEYDRNDKENQRASDILLENLHVQDSMLIGNVKVDFVYRY